MVSEINPVAQVENDAAPEGEAATPVTMESLSELLADDSGDFGPPEGDDKSGAADGDIKKDAKPTMFNDLAGSLGIELDDLYKLKVSTVDGKTVTIEELKSLQGTQDDLTIRELEFEESRATKEGELRQAQTELAEVVASLPNGTIKPEVMEKLRAKNATRIGVEQARTMEAIPSWENQDTRTADLKGMALHLSRFGFPVDYLGTVTDHRMFVFVRESHLREQRIQKALEKVRAGKPNPTTSTKTVSKITKVNQAKHKPDARNGLESFFNDA